MEVGEEEEKEKGDEKWQQHHSSEAFRLWLQQNMVFFS